MSEPGQLDDVRRTHNHELFDRAIANAKSQLDSGNLDAMTLTSLGEQLRADTAELTAMFPTEIELHDSLLRRLAFAGGIASDWAAESTDSVILSLQHIIAVFNDHPALANLTELSRHRSHDALAPLVHQELADALAKHFARNPLPASTIVAILDAVWAPNLPLVKALLHIG
jgi:hypothetical protein